MSADLYKALFESSGTEIKNDYIISWASEPINTDDDKPEPIKPSNNSGVISW